MELITGYKGSPHVTAAQFAALSRGFLTGSESGALVDPVTEGFQTQIQSNNEVRIRSGIGVLQGRAFWVQPGSYDEITINNGNQGENRIDLVVARLPGWLYRERQQRVLLRCRPTHREILTMATTLLIYPCFRCA